MKPAQLFVFLAIFCGSVFANDRPHILIYLADKTAKFLPDRTTEPNAHYDVIQWLMFQMGGVGPMFGQAGHFRNYALERYSPDEVQYGIDRYTNEVHRLYGVCLLYTSDAADE